MLTPEEMAVIHETVEKAMADTLPEQVVELRRQRDALIAAGKMMLGSLDGTFGEAMDAAGKLESIIRGCENKSTMKTPHSRGPWQIVLGRNGAVVGIDSSEDRNEPGAVVTVVRNNGLGMPSSQTGLANARLIAAAPELLAACKEAFWAVGGEEYEPERFNRAKGLCAAAIALCEFDDPEPPDPDQTPLHQPD